VRECNPGEIAAACPPWQERRPGPAAGGAAVVSGISGGCATAPRGPRGQEATNRRSWAGRRRGNRLHSTCSCHAKNRNGRGEREEQARREEQAAELSFVGIHCRIAQSILLKATSKPNASPNHY